MSLALAAATADEPETWVSIAPSPLSRPFTKVNRLCRIRQSWCSNTAASSFNQSRVQEHAELWWKLINRGDGPASEAINPYNRCFNKILAAPMHSKCLGTDR